MTLPFVLAIGPTHEKSELSEPEPVFWSDSSADVLLLCDTPISVDVKSEHDPEIGDMVPS